MVARFELFCSHCQQAFEYPSRCSLAQAVPRLDRRGREGGAREDSLAPMWGRGVGFPTVCLRCGQLGVHRADNRRGWCCSECASCEVHQLGFDSRGGAAVVGVALAVVLVVMPMSSSVVWGLPGLAVLALLVVGGFWIERQGRLNLSRAPCSICGERGVRERRARASSIEEGAGRPVAAPRSR